MSVKVKFKNKHVFSDIFSFAKAKLFLTSAISDNFLFSNGLLRFARNDRRFEIAISMLAMTEDL